MNLSPVKRRIFYYTSFIAALVAASTLVYVNAEGWRTIDAFYFSIVTLATVGYGDHYPVTAFGKLFTSGYILFGVSAFLLLLNDISRYLHHKTQ